MSCDKAPCARPGVSEIVDLRAAAAAELMVKIAQVSRVLKGVTQCDKLIVAAIGNVVPQFRSHCCPPQGRPAVAEAGLGLRAAARRR